MGMIFTLCWLYISLSCILASHTSFCKNTSSRKLTVAELIIFMTEKIPDNIRKALQKASALHQRAVSDYAQCIEFSKTMSETLVALEDANCIKTADKVMSILINCNPKEGAHCDNSALVGEKMKKISTS
jgi:hypothetical protein